MSRKHHRLLSVSNSTCFHVLVPTAGSRPAVRRPFRTKAGLAQVKDEESQRRLSRFLQEQTPAPVDDGQQVPTPAPVEEGAQPVAPTEPPTEPQAEVNPTPVPEGKRVE